ncbi:hypothetical protein EV1_035386 [Malus domestica]
MEVQAVQLENSRSLFPLSHLVSLCVAESKRPNETLKTSRVLHHQTPIRVVLHRFSFSHHRLPPLATKCSLRHPNLKSDEELIKLIPIFELEEQLDFPVLYASAKEGWASTTLTKDPPADARNMSRLLDAIISHVPPPTANLDATFQMLPCMLSSSPLNWKYAVSSGTIRIGDRVHGLRHKDSGVEKIEEGKVVKLMKKKGTHMVVIECAGAGDIVSMAGLTSRPSIGHTVASVETMTALPTVVLDPPTISMTFGVNDSPLAGRDGTHCMGKVRVRETGASSLRSTTRQASLDGGSGNPKRSACSPRSSSGSRDCSPVIGPGR